ncbi:MAG: PilT/PilU family type 4a pilus ATPase, partial [Candidatus Uhrbacteria bacterium]
RRPRGLVLITGPTGSGKSTTLAAMIGLINNERHVHIVTIEDPIEFLYTHGKSVIDQREVGSDTASFKSALRRVLRQTPDVILIGELRDLETIETALTIAETGHLCLATLHTSSAVQTVNRIVDVFPPYQQPQVRTVLACVLEGIIAQTLLPCASGSGRVLACEIMVPNAAIRNLIREDKLHQITSQMQVGQHESGMQTINQALAALVHQGRVTQEVALAHTSEATELQKMLAGPTAR